jgi:hypothetical protein
MIIAGALRFPQLGTLLFSTVAKPRISHRSPFYSALRYDLLSTWRLDNVSILLHGSQRAAQPGFFTGNACQNKARKDNLNVNRRKQGRCPSPG